MFPSKLSHQSSQDYWRHPDFYISSAAWSATINTSLKFKMIREEKEFWLAPACNNKNNKIFFTVVNQITPETPFHEQGTRFWTVLTSKYLNGWQWTCWSCFALSDHTENNVGLSVSHRAGTWECWKLFFPCGNAEFTETGFFFFFNWNYLGSLVSFALSSVTKFVQFHWMYFNWEGYRNYVYQIGNIRKHWN